MEIARGVPWLLGSLLLIALVQPAPVLAHAGLLRSDPPDPCGPLAQPRLKPDDPRCASGYILARPPSSIHLLFSESVTPFGGGITVIAPSGRRVDRGAARANVAVLSVPVDAVEEGTYRVRWRVIGTDTHPARGGYAFSVGRASIVSGVPSPAGDDLGAVSPLGLGLQVVSRWLHFAGYALGFGSLAFLFFVLQPAGLQPSPSLPAFSQSIEPRNRATGESRRILRLAGAGVLVLLLAELLALLAQGASGAANGALDLNLAGDALASSFGRVLAQRLSAALLLWVLLGIVQQGSVRLIKGILVLGLLLALMDGEASHAVSSGPLWLGLGVNAMHVAAMGFWVGGLVSLLAVWSSPDLGERRADVVRRFGRFAGISVLCLAVSGTIMAFLHLSGPASLLTNGYGQALLLKSAVLLVVLLLALAGRRGGRARRKRWWSLERAALLGLLALAGLLVSLPPPR
ncbi:MAG: copper resistance CopC/CopD family protein [Dehalococcoidia bacterium]